MARKGSLSKKSYWPGTGDILENPEDGVTWECVRSNVYHTLKGVKVRYGLLIGTTPEFEEPIVEAIHDRDGSKWLECIMVIKRPGKEEGSFKTYEYNKETETWQEES